MPPAVVKRRMQRTYGSRKRSRFTEASKSSFPRARLGPILNPEVKYRETVVRPASLANNGLINYKLTDIAQGEDVNQRLGNRIEIIGVKFLGSAGDGNPNIDLHLVTPFSTTDPAHTDFSLSCGAAYPRTKGIEWWHRVHGNSPNHFQTVNLYYQFKQPLKVHYSGSASTQCIRNLLYFTMHNQSGASIADINMTVTLYYQDA